MGARLWRMWRLWRVMFRRWPGRPVFCSLSGVCRTGGRPPGGIVRCPDSCFVSAGGSGRGGDGVGYCPLRREDDRPAAALPALHRRGGLAGSPRRQFCHARRGRFPSVLCGLGGGADGDARRCHGPCWQDIAAKREQRFERGHSQGRGFRGAPAPRVPGQIKAGEKPKEILAHPALPDIMAVGGAVTTIDALGCQRHRAENH